LPSCASASRGSRWYLTHMLASGVAIGLAAGLFAGGRASRLAELSIRWWPVLAVGVAIRIAPAVAGELPLPLYIVALACIALVAWANRALPGMPWILAGAVGNALVVALNGGMPVHPDAARLAGATIPSDGLHRPLSNGDALPFLADVIPVPLAAGVYSLGDVALSFGSAWLVFVQVRGR